MDVTDQQTLRSIGDYRDAEGRLLAERGASDLGGASFDMRRCPYRDARFGGEMNVDALRQMRTHWHESLAAIRVLERDNRCLYGDATAPLTRLRRLTRVLGSLPEFLVLFHGTATGAVPPLAAVLYKLARGLNTVTDHLTYHARDLPEIAPEPLWEYLERHRLLIGRDEVCAGPKALIVDALAALTGQPGGDAGTENSVTSRPTCPLEPFLTPAHRRMAVRYGVGLSDHLLIRRILAEAFAAFAEARSAEAPDPRSTRHRIATLLAKPCVRASGLRPPVLDGVLAETRRALSTFVVDGPGPVGSALPKRIDDLWARAMAERSREVATIAGDLGVRLRADIQISDIPERLEMLATVGGPGV